MNLKKIILALTIGVFICMESSQQQQQITIKQEAGQQQKETNKEKGENLIQQSRGSKKKIIKGQKKDEQRQIQQIQQIKQEEEQQIQLQGREQQLERQLQQLERQLQQLQFQGQEQQQQKEELKREIKTEFEANYPRTLIRFFSFDLHWIMGNMTPWDLENLNLTIIGKVNNTRVEKIMIEVLKGIKGLNVYEGLKDKIYSFISKNMTEVSFDGDGKITFVDPSYKIISKETLTVKNNEGKAITEGEVEGIRNLINAILELKGILSNADLDLNGTQLTFKYLTFEDLDRLAYLNCNNIYMKTYVSEIINANKGIQKLQKTLKENIVQPVLSRFNEVKRLMKNDTFEEHGALLMFCAERRQFVLNNRYNNCYITGSNYTHETTRFLAKLTSKVQPVEKKKEIEETFNKICEKIEELNTQELIQRHIGSIIEMKELLGERLGKHLLKLKTENL